MNNGNRVDDTISFVVDMLNEAETPFRFETGAGWRAIIVGGALRVWSDDLQSHVGFTDCAKDGYPLGSNRIELENVTADVLTMTVTMLVARLSA